MLKERYQLTRRSLLKLAAAPLLAPLAAACAPQAPPEAPTKSPELSTADKLKTAEAELDIAEATQLVKLETAEAEIEELEATRTAQAQSTPSPEKAATMPTIVRAVPTATEAPLPTATQVPPTATEVPTQTPKPTEAPKATETKQPTPDLKKTIDAAVEGTRVAEKQIPSPTLPKPTETEKPASEEEIQRRVEAAVKATRTAQENMATAEANLKADIQEQLPESTAQATEEVVQQKIPTREVRESQTGKIWEIKVTEHKFGRYDGQGSPPPPSFSWNGNALFVTNAEGVPTEIDLMNPNKEKWKWRHEGFVFDTDKDTFYLVRQEKPRVDALDAASKEEKWNYDIPQFALGAQGEGRFWASGIKWPIVGTNSDYLAIQLEVGYLFRNKKLGYTYPLGRGAARVESLRNNLMVMSYPDKTSSTTYLLALKLPSAESLTATAETTVNIKGSTGHVTDGETLVVSLPAISANTGTTIQASEVRNGKTWQKELLLGTLPISIHRNFVVARAQFDSDVLVYFILRRQDGEIVKELISTDMENHLFVEWNFFEKGNWFFASHLRQGTFAYFNGPAWVNDKVLGADTFLGEVDQNLLFSRAGGKFGANAMVWAVDKAGKKFAWQPVFFDQMTTAPIRIGDTAIIASRFALNSVDLKTGAVKEIFKSDFITHLVNTGTNRIVLGQTAGVDPKLFAARV